MIRRTAGITAASLTGIILAGAAAATNLGILTAAADSNLGQLSAEAPIATPASDQDGASDSLPTSGDATQSFTVDVAGKVEVEYDEDGLHIGEVRPSQGWTWQETAAADGTVVVTFGSSGDELVFTATSNNDGTISASVDRSVTTSSKSPAIHIDDEHHEGYEEYEEDEHHEEYEEDEDDHPEYEEYEGRDDDD